MKGTIHLTDGTEIEISKADDFRDGLVDGRVTSSFVINSGSRSVMLWNVVYIEWHEESE